MQGKQLLRDLCTLHKDAFGSTPPGTTQWTPAVSETALDCVWIMARRWCVLRQQYGQNIGIIAQQYRVSEEVRTSMAH